MNSFENITYKGITVPLQKMVHFSCQNKRTTGPTTVTRVQSSSIDKTGDIDCNYEIYTDGKKFSKIRTE